MRVKKLMNLILIVICLCLIAGIGAFIYNAVNRYKINSNFVSVPLQFNPEDSSSVYKLESAQITVNEGFVKGIQRGKDWGLVIRALSPLPSITVNGSNTDKISLLIENINPDFYAKSIAGSKLSMTKVKVNTLQLKINLYAGKTVKIDPIQPRVTDNKEKQKYIILGDNRDGYDTFGQIIQQVNGQNPVFVIDNGDLVYSGNPNQYRLFDRMVSNISATFCTTLGNHDIRRNGRSIYTMLYGPAYYSFNYEDNHFAFLDSSQGWAEKRAISEQQYKWLEKDLKKA